MSSSQELQLLMAENYAASYAIFLKRWHGQKEASLDIMRRHLQAALAGQPAISVLSVGPGPGDFDVQVAHMLQELSDDRPVRYVAVEPNPVHRRVFTSTIQAAGFHHVHFDLHPMGVETFATDEQFDCIHYTHSLYHMPGQEKTLILAALKMLKTKGILVMIIDTNDAGIHRISRRYPELIGHTLGQASPPLPSADRVIQILRELGLVYEQAVFEEYLDVTPCFEENTQEGAVLLDFVFQAQMSNSATELKQRALSILAEEVLAQDGRKLLAIPSATLVIPKQ